ncbi:MFS transporter [Pedobacter nutrimenti]|uniref:Putative MFS family arabinose efflux permease n=1 Tax=Pedobacter nutrimenti TaxID=1241337 RepID=A0A318USC1_9SPHI|nr:MFS transporter [Pedobacter nutrimenti]PYF76995.1 putative MFS family arabinose efflux permease [Pedobacter nutrimenti]
MKIKQTNNFTDYQKFVIFILAITQFTVILDFMVMSPLGDLLIKSLDMKPSHFGIAVSAYAFSAGISGLLTAGFADRFDRKKLLLFFYTGFIAGTIFCGISTSYQVLVAARIITGLFGGVISSISMAIIADIFVLEQRGRVMGFVQMGFGASQVLGIPIGLFIANLWGWEAPFLMIAGMAILIAIFIALKLKPVNEHLKMQRDKTAFKHLLHTLVKSNYHIGYMATAVLSIGGFMMMPFGSVFAVNNLGVTEKQLPLLFMVSGVSALVIMPLIGRLSDQVSKYKLFTISCLWMIITCVIYTNLSATPLWIVMCLNVVMMMGIMGRMVPSSALTSAVPDMADRGAFMSINSSLQQIAGGIAAAVSGLIVVQKDKFSPLQHYDIVGYVVVVISLISIFLMYRVNQLAIKRAKESGLPTSTPDPESEIVPIMEV